MRRPVYTVYRINLPDGRGYVGCTKHGIEQRFVSHATSAPRYDDNPNGVGAAIRRYGAENCTIEALASSIAPESAAELETLLIAQHETLFPRGYNLRARGVVRGALPAPRPPKPVREWIIIAQLPKGNWPPIQGVA